ncbi:MAG TPA: S8 family serine peptidase, partial [Actinomycetota bacterium]|nr:S8 family serine peptidase [Actinomycetota bacterium]
MTVSRLRASSRVFLSFLIAMAMVVGIFAVTPRDARAAHTSTTEPTDPLFQLSQWGPKQVRAEQAWHTTRGEGAIVAVVDSGVDLDHEDLASQVIPGNTFVDCGDAGCGNGDWESGIDTPSSHGTHVSGIVAAAADNGIGIAGVAPGAKLLAVKVATSGFLPCLEEAFQDVARG